MARRARTKAASQTETTTSETTTQPITHENEAEPVEPDPVEPDIFDQIIAQNQRAAAHAQEAGVSTAADAHAPATNGFVAKLASGGHPTPDRKSISNPFGVENILGDVNRVRLLKEEPDHKNGFPGAWVIRFEQNPNAMADAEGMKYSKERPHPVLKMLKDEGYRWGFSNGDDTGGWGKLMQEGHYTYAEHMDARKVLGKAAEMIGAKVEQGAGIPD